MTNCEQDKLDFDVLVARCAGPDRKEQECYLARVIMKLLIERFGRDSHLPDANVLWVLGICEDDVVAAMRVLDGIYTWVSKSLLGDSRCDMSAIREGARDEMLKELIRRQEFQHDPRI